MLCSVFPHKRKGTLETMESYKCLLRKFPFILAERDKGKWMSRFALLLLEKSRPALAWWWDFPVSQPAIEASLLASQTWTSMTRLENKHCMFVLKCRVNFSSTAWILILNSTGCHYSWIREVALNPTQDTPVHTCIRAGPRPMPTHALR
jgi:hypothetical protein